MMINRRRVYGEKGLLPSGYKQLEYIESTGTQYIDTGIACNHDSYDFDILISRPLKGYNSIIFVQNLQNGNRFNVAQVVALNKIINLGLGDSSTTTTTISYSSFSEPLHVIKHIDKDTAYGTINNVAYNCSYTADSYKIDNLNIILLAKNAVRNSNISISEQYTGQLYSCVIKINNILVRNLIPAKRNSDSVVGMYDTVSGTFFTNAGTGTFIAGPEV